MKAAAVRQLGQDGVRYGLYFPLAALFPLPTAYGLAQAWGRLEARQAPPGLLDVIRSNAAEALRPAEPPAVDMGEKFFEVMSCDRIDAYAAWLYSWRRLERWVRVSGEERLLSAVAEKRGILLLTFHFGGGSLIFPYLRSRGLGAHLLANALPQVRQVEGWIPYAFARRRFAQIARVTEREVIFVSATSPRKIQRALSAGGMVVALLDVLPEFVGVKAWREQRVPFLGRPARFPTSLLSIVARADATIVPFFGWVGADRRREFAFEEPRRVTDPDDTLAGLVGLLEQYIRRYPYEWHHWPVLQDFYRQAGER
ncbi:MAG: hypothetical protein OXC18_03430 [Desulfurellaceae bacterium]|nr:hypothetical protein [Desulfurellaceae bacterium]